jgi:hypothetical protein
MQEDDEGREGEHKRSEPEDNEDGGVSRIISNAAGSIDMKPDT